MGLLKSGLGAAGSIGFTMAVTYIVFFILLAPIVLPLFFLWGLVTCVFSALGCFGNHCASRSSRSSRSSSSRPRHTRGYRDGKGIWG